MDSQLKLDITLSDKDDSRFDDVINQVNGTLRQTGVTFSWKCYTPSDDSMSDLHDRIMNIPLGVNMAMIGLKQHMIAYKEGHRDARHAAAEMSIGYVKLSEEQERMLEAGPEMLRALQDLLITVQDQCDTGVYPFALPVEKARAAIEKATSVAGTGNEVTIAKALGDAGNG